MPDITKPVEQETTLIHIYYRDNTQYDTSATLSLTYPQYNALAFTTAEEANPEHFKSAFEHSKVQHLLNTIMNARNNGVLATKWDGKEYLVYIAPGAISRMSFTGFIPEGIAPGALHR